MVHGVSPGLDVACASEPPQKGFVILCGISGHGYLDECEGDVRVTTFPPSTGCRNGSGHCFTLLVWCGCGLTSELSLRRGQLEGLFCGPLSVCGLRICSPYFGAWSRRCAGFQSQRISWYLRFDIWHLGLGYFLSMWLSAANHSSFCFTWSQYRAW